MLTLLALVLSLVAAASKWQGTDIRISAGPGRLYTTVRIPLQKDPRVSSTHMACDCQFLNVDGTSTSSLCMGTYAKVPGLVQGGRSVYKKDNSPLKVIYLFYSEKYSKWQVSLLCCTYSNRLQFPCRVIV